ncbi:hypothetical protein [Paenibacillus hamazuiensis]|uniref:hypothetical protein n=1 Tax=Paenibacillus hamazuiensis TaxID=2936508 RepID=UPI00200FD49B|nr:hypothetical protein [Paenibacillus hamazuiensis]
MNIHRPDLWKTARIVLTAFLVFTLLCLAFAVCPPNTTYAGKEGVFINSSVYFTLEDVTLSQGTDTQMMRFNVKLNNDGESTVDFNHYGVKVTSAAGGSYYAELSQKTDALVAAHTGANFYYVATVPGGLASSDLKVTIFERNGSQLTDIGSLSVANAQSLREQAHQLVVNLADVDTTLTGSSFVAFQAVKAIAVPKDGKWDISVDVTASPTGSESVTIPAGLKYLLQDGQGRTFLMTANAVDGTTVGVGQTKHILLTATMETQPDASALALVLSRDNSVVSAFGKLALASLFQLNQPGEKVSYAFQDRQGISLEVQKAEQQEVSGKKQAVITAVLHNDGKTTLQSPTLQGTLISKADTLAVNATTVMTPETYIVAGEAGVYKFAAELPDGASPDQLQFVISESRSSSGSSNANSNSSSGSSGSSSSSSSQSSTSSGSSSQASGSSSSAGSTSGAIPIIAVSLSGGLASVTDMGQLPQYTLGQPFVFNAGSHLIDSNLEMSVVELNAHTNAENGFQTVVAKFKLLNKSSDTLALPSFDTSLTDASGTSYPGTKQTTTLTQLIPNTAYVYSYSYLLPPSATGTFKLSILDPSNSSKIKVPISEYQVAVSQTGEEDPTAPQKVLSVYPFNVKIEDWILSEQYNSGSYYYKLKLNLDVQKTDEVITDDSFSTLEFEVVDSLGRVLGSTTQTLQGANKLISGMQTIDFGSIKSEQFEFPVTIRIYEDIPTAGGSAKRLVATLKQ